METIEKRKGCEWASIELSNEEPTSFEYMSDENDDESYVEGSLIIDNGTLIDYDGVYELPRLVKDLITEQGFSLGDCE